MSAEKVVSESTHSKEEIRGFLPNLTEEEKDLIDNLPSEYRLEVPYEVQEEKHWSGAAVVQMVTQYHGEEPDAQEEIVREAGWEDWGTFDHATFREKLIRYFVRNGFLASEYYPQGHIAPELGDGRKAADFIKQNKEPLAEIDFEYLKALLVSREAPVVVRIHFTREDYPMPEEMAQRLDLGGHCLLVTGYDEDGFIFHDPWRQDEWGGKYGGPENHRTYEELAINKVFTNTTRDEFIAIDKLEAHFTPAYAGVHTEKEFPIQLRYQWPGLKGIQHDWYGLESIQMEIKDDSVFEFATAKKSLDEPLHPGEEFVTEWNVISGSEVGSYRIEADLTGRIQQPQIPWEADSEELDAEIQTNVSTRQVVYPEDRMQKFGLRNQSEPTELQSEAESVSVAGD